MSSNGTVVYDGTIPTGGDSMTEDLNRFYGVRQLTHRQPKLLLMAVTEW